MCTVKPNPRGPRRIIIGGLRFVTNGESSRHGDVSRELAVLEPPPPPGDCTPPPPTALADGYSSIIKLQSGYVYCYIEITEQILPEEIIRDSPSADALFTTDLERCLRFAALPIYGTAFSDDDVPVSGL